MIKFESIHHFGNFPVISCHICGSEEDPWAEDDPLVEELSFFPRPSAATRVQMAQYQNSGGVSGITGGGLSSLGKRRMLMKQASVSSIK